MKKNNQHLFFIIFLLIFLMSTTPVSAEDDRVILFENRVQAIFEKTEATKNSVFPSYYFDTWVFYMTEMDKNTIGTFKFSNRGTWTKKGHYETYISGITVGSGLKKAWDLCYYRYKSREDRWRNNNGFKPFAPEDKLNKAKLKQREKRFFFFKFTGTAAFNTKLDNSMICVDTYTKFVWFYSEPGIIKRIVGNAVPTKWVDYEDPNLSKDHRQVYSKFYMYDPIGYVTKTGDVILYDWAKTMIKNADYHPRQQFKTPAGRNPAQQGHSPYLPPCNKN